VGLTLHFIPTFDPVLLEGAGMLAERISVRTNNEGRASVNLVRFAKYDVTVEGIEDTLRQVIVPDAAAVNLPDLLFPVVRGVSFDTVLPIEISVGTTVEITAHVFTTDLRELDQLGSDVLWSLSNPDLVNFEVRQHTIWLQGIRPGSSQLLAERKDKTIVRIPNTPIIGVPLPFSVI
jgi:hypothetical protein